MSVTTQEHYIAIVSSYLALSLLFVFDVVSDPVTSFHPLYIFPLAFIALVRDYPQGEELPV
jgi:hypothetical protein